MKKVIIILLLFVLIQNICAQPRRNPYDVNFTRQYVHRNYGPSRELVIFTRSWNRLCNAYIASVTFSNRLSSISNFDFPAKDPEELLSEYYSKINEINTAFLNQQAANNAMIDAGIRGLGEIVAQAARNNNITTKDAFLDFAIKEIGINAVQNRVKQKNAQELELERRRLQEQLESNLSTQMSAIRDEILEENSRLRDSYLEAMAFEGDLSKEKYFTNCYDYYDCFSRQIRSEYSYNSSSWYKPRCSLPTVSYSSRIPNDYVDIAQRKLALYKKYNKEVLMEGVNLFLDAGLAENKQNPKAYFLKSQLETDIINKLFYLQVAITLDSQNQEYEEQFRSVSSSFNNRFFTAIKNDDQSFISKSIEKGFHLGREEGGISAIEKAIELDKAYILQMLVMNSSDNNNSFPESGKGLLFHACAVDALESVKRLISMGVNPEIPDKNFSGVTALNIALENESQKTITYLAANFNIKPALQFTRRADPESLIRIATVVYEAAPSKLADIKAVYPKFGSNNPLVEKQVSQQSDQSLVKVYSRTETTEYFLKDQANQEDINEDVSYVNFSASNYGNFVDSRDGRQYGWVRINNLIWMSDNLSYLPDDNEDIGEYDNSGNPTNSGYSDSYGVLYNYKTALKSCPQGWRLPSDLEWSKLESYLDNTIIDLNQISYRGTTIGSQLINTKPGSFKAKYGGKRLSNGSVIGFENLGSYWTSSKAENAKAWNRQIQKGLPQIIRLKSDENEGNSVRCVRSIQ